MFSMVISVISVVISVISVDFGDFGEPCYPRVVISKFFKDGVIPVTMLFIFLISEKKRKMQVVYSEV